MKRWQRIFAVMWAGQFLSFLTSAVVGYALIFHLSLQTHSAEVLALGVVAGFLPQILIGPLAGVYIDRWSRKRTMILADTFIASCTAVLIWLFWSGHAAPWHIYLLMSARSLGNAFHAPAMEATVPLLAPTNQLTRMAGIEQMIQSVCNIVAPGLAAALVVVWSMPSILLLDIAGAIVACVSLAYVIIPRPRRVLEKPHLGREMREGARAIFSVDGLWQLSLFALGFFFIIMPLAALFPLLTLDHYGRDVAAMGTVEVLWSAGSLAGGVLLGVRVWRVNKARLINVAYILAGGYLIVSGALSPRMFPVYVALTALGGMVAAVSQASFVAIMQTHVPSRLLGRAMSFYFSASMLPAMLGLLLTGWVVEHVGLTAPFVAGGAVVVLLGFFALGSKAVGRVGRI